MSTEIRFLSRWAILVVLVVVGLMIGFFVGVGQDPTDSALGEEYQELFAAARAPVAYKVTMLFDMLGWLTLGGSLLGMAFLVRGSRPLASLLIGACGVAQVTGILGGAMRLEGVGDLADRVAVADAAEQASLLASHLDIFRVIGSHFLAGQIVQGAGFLLAAWAVAAVPGFPRWLAFWIGLPGVTSLALFVLGVTGVLFFPFLVIHVVLGILGAHAAMALALPRRRIGIGLPQPAPPV